MRVSSVYDVVMRIGIGLLSVIAAAALTGPPSAAGAVIGPPDIASNWSGSYGCGIEDAPCAYANLGLPAAPDSETGFGFDIAAGKVRSPFKGTITKWRVNIEEFTGTGLGPLALQVLRRDVNQPGLAADEFRVVKQSQDEVSQFGPNTFFTSLRIRKSDFIGLSILGADTSVRELDAGTLGFLETPLALGDASSPFDDVIANRQILLNATVKR